MTVPIRHPSKNAGNSLPPSSCPVNRRFVHVVFYQMYKYARSGVLGLLRSSGLRMSDRAARRLCVRVVELGGLRELTNRSSFGLCGL